MCIRDSCSGPRRKLRNAGLWCAFGLCWGLYGGAALCFWELLPVGLWIGLFVVMVLALGVVMHLGVPVFGELVIDNIPKKRRGLVITVRHCVLGAGGLVGVLFTRRLMDSYEGPTNFHLRFLIGSGLFAGACVFWMMLRDVSWDSRPPEPKRAPALGAVRTLFNNFNFRTFLVFQMLLLAACNLMPLMLGYGRDVLHLDAAEREFFIMAFFLGMIVVGLSVPFLADHFGFRAIATINALLLMSAFMIPVIAGASRTAAYISYGLYAGSYGLNMMVLANLGAEMVPEVRPATIIAAGGTLAMPLSLALAPVGGWLVDMHEGAGYLCAFVVGATLSLCAAIGFALIVREPRTGQELFVRLRKY